MWRVLVGIVVGIALVFILNIGVETPFRGLFAIPVDEVGGNVDVNTGSITIPGGTTQPPQGGTNPPPPGGQQPAPSGQVVWEGNIPGTAADGVLVNLEVPGTYQVTVEGGFNNGWYERSLTTVLLGGGPVTYDANKQPRGDKWLGSSDNPTSGSVTFTTSTTVILIVPVDSSDSYEDNFGEYHVKVVRKG